MTLREKILKESLRERVSVYDIGDGDVSIMCPKNIGDRLFAELGHDGISCRQPKRIIFGDDNGNIEHPDYEVVATIGKEDMERRVDSLIEGLKLTD